MRNSVNLVLLVLCLVIDVMGHVGI